ncbi:hypothetical protein Aau02nite_79230 [Amorphoplanes auranticolor]|uniref:Uncharacterized protein n=1 Tax=Actinoplanes auranticolor TaxID=47988 RepID=A0A919SSB0_9ACTN|nr:hypothetical protein Aau02nite_79230 [Actinoplanes auranticolor]
MRDWPPLWIVYVPLRSVGVLPHPAVAASTEGPPAATVPAEAATTPAPTRSAAAARTTPASDEIRCLLTIAALPG